MAQRIDRGINSLPRSVPSLMNAQKDSGLIGKIVVFTQVGCSDDDPMKKYQQPAVFTITGFQHDNGLDEEPTGILLRASDGDDVTIDNRHSSLTTDYFILLEDWMRYVQEEHDRQVAEVETEKATAEIQRDQLKEVLVEQAAVDRRDDEFDGD